MIWNKFITANTVTGKDTNNKDELFEILKHFKNNPVVESLVFKQDLQCIFVSLSRQGFIQAILSTGIFPKDSVSLQFP